MRVFDSRKELYMLRQILLGNSPKEYLIAFIMCLPVMLLSLSVHESAHGYAAYKCGDQTARNFGRITLNPVKHLDPIGFLCMMFVGFGWAKPVPVNSRNFKNHRRGMILTALAGPVSNLLLGFIFAVIYKILFVALGNFQIQTEQQFMILQAIVIFLGSAISLNISLAVFNLLPIPPLDGSKILFTLLPYKLYFKIMPYEKYISIAFAALLIFGVLTPVISWCSSNIMNLFFTILAI